MYALFFQLKTIGTLMWFTSLMAIDLYPELFVLK